ncbi:chaperonin 10-like protein [Xylariales sp. PMI_506]|nr:chaperonin 10-like protein [Xylariales sp. PMI_506]
MPGIRDIPKTMKAILQPEKTSHKLTLTEQPVPSPSHPEDVLIKVAATSPCLGELDWALWAPEFLGDKVPIPGQDVSGTVVSAPGASRFREGDEVYARIPANRAGAGAEYVLARTTELALKPRNLDLVEAAAVPLSALTAYQALFVKGNLEVAALPVKHRGGGYDDNNDNDDDNSDAAATAARARNAAKQVMITAAAGSVGSWAVQFAKLAGAGAIVAVCGTRSAEAARKFGATDIVDYTQESITEWAAHRDHPASAKSHCVDLVVDCVGGDTLSQCWYAVKGAGAGGGAGGRLISICAVPEEKRPPELAGVKKGVHSEWFVMESLGDNLAVITELIEQGACRPVIDSVVEFADFERAWEKVESGHAKGKVVVKIRV